MEVFYRRYEDGERMVYHEDTQRIIHITLGYPIAYIVPNKEEQDCTINDVRKYGKKFVFDNGKFDSWWNIVARIQSRDEKNVVMWNTNLSEEVQKIKSEMCETLDHLFE